MVRCRARETLKGGYINQEHELRHGCSVCSLISPATRRGLQISLPKKTPGVTCTCKCEIQAASLGEQHSAKRRKLILCALCGARARPLTTREAESGVRVEGDGDPVHLLCGIGQAISHLLSIR